MTRVLLIGGSGSIGQATARALVAAGHQVTALLRSTSTVDLPGCRVLQVEFADPAALAAALTDSRAEAVISCLASRSGLPADAWAVDHATQSRLLNAALGAGVGRFVLLSAICVQKPKLAFQRAKLAFEADLQAAPLNWTIVRPTAFFKSLSGQVARVQAGKPFLAFGDGRLTACKPISDRDLGRFLAECLTDPQAANRILPIGGPGPAITPLDQAAMLARLTGLPVRVRRVPVGLMDGIIALLSGLGRLSARQAARSEFARIGRYYGTESMLVWNAAHGRYDADATPEFGTDRLEDHYAALLQGKVTADLGAHAAF